MREARSPTVLLIGGTGRSGSTLLHRLLGQLPGFVAVGELRYLWTETLAENRLCGCGERFLACRFWSGVGRRAFGGWDRVDVEEVAALQRSVARHRHIPLLALPDVAPARYRARLGRYHRTLQATYRAIHEASGASVIVDSTKDPAYAFALRRMPGIDVRLLHLVRDSRGVAWSWAKVVRSPEVVDRQHYMRRFSPLMTGVRWDTYNLMVESLGSFGVPRQFLRYERLVEDAGAALTAIASFAGRPVDARGLSFLELGGARLGVHHTVAGNPMRMAAGHVDIRADEAWRTSMPWWQRAAVTAVTWPLLRHYSYSMSPARGGAAPASVAGGGAGT